MSHTHSPPDPPPAPDGAGGDASEFRTVPPAARAPGRAAAEMDAAAGGSASDSLVGHDVGGVRIMRMIADGGMGRVYEGVQDRPRRTVAIKVIKPGFVSPSLIKRFEYEAHVLGSLSHPGIAQIHHVGTYGEGTACVPYFVMEYIPNAKTITQYATDKGLSTRQRLELFRAACEAVAHGHLKGVVHRDLKPSNILVDASGHPKVIDFGVARSTHADAMLTTMHTDVGQLVGTLQYMSPEQLDAKPDAIDVRSDVYSLGLVLYELMSNRRPYDLTRKVISEIARIIREDPVPSLSHVNRTISRDIGVIAGKCLEKTADQRYGDAAELAADIIRFLTGEQIAAVPPSLWARARRTAKRYRAQLLVGVVATACLAGGTVAVSWAGKRVAVEKGRAATERARAELIVGGANAAAKVLAKAGTLKTLTNEQALALAKAKGRLDLSALESLTDDQARIVATHGGDLRLPALRSLTVSQARELARKGMREDVPHPNVLRGPNAYPFIDLGGLTEASDEVIAELAKYPGYLGLTGLKTLTTAAAEALGNHAGMLSLDGLTSLSDPAAAALARHRAALSLPGLTTLSDQAAASLAESPSAAMRLTGLTRLSDMAVRVLQRNQKILLPERFVSRQERDEPVPDIRVGEPFELSVRQLGGENQYDRRATLDMSVQIPGTTVQCGNVSRRDGKAIAVLSPDPALMRLTQPTLGTLLIGVNGNPPTTRLAVRVMPARDAGRPSEHTIVIPIDR